MFRIKSLGLQTQRYFRDRTSRIKRFAKSDDLVDKPLIAESFTPLWTEIEPEERFLVAGKIQNLRVATAALDGLEIPGGEVFSFWKHVGRTTRLRGFVEGRELREGCIIPNVGGGLCQLSNALYDAALKGNFEIVERYAHTAIIPGSLAETGRDATVFWNYVDLRFRSKKPFRIDARLDADGLSVRFRGEKDVSPTLHKISRKPVSTPAPNSCATCGVNECHRMVDPAQHAEFGKTAFLVDDVWPEFDEYIQSVRKPQDLLCLPLDGRRYGKGNYAWTTSGFADIRQMRLLTLLRSVKSRRLAVQGASRQQNLIDTYRLLAKGYVRSLTYDALHIVVQQNLLPFLWQTGQLGGRTFDVLMTALPVKQLQERLDLARSMHPESTTLGDFRADPRLVDAESEALANARRIITPHSDIARLFPDKAELLEWKTEFSGTRESGNSQRPTVLFPASTVGRKGCYEMREAIRDLGIKLLTMGPDIEGSEFWDGFDVQHVGNEGLSVADVVVLPAFVEHKPRRLLSAVAMGIPVIASTACGIDGLKGVNIVKFGDAVALRDAIVAAVMPDGPK